jgi:hypothetical protein
MTDSYNYLPAIVTAIGGLIFIASGIYLIRWSRNGKY